MNEFTKEELEELMHCVYAYRDLCDEDVEDNLCDKLKSMIDNYCEHECNGIRYAVIKLRSTDERDYEYKCSKCKKVLFQY